jgi:hypothetical protein
VPLVFKNNIDVAGMPTTAGSPWMADHVPRINAGVAQRLLDAGALVLGKSNLHEGSRGVTGHNHTDRPARNPHDPSRIAGGSSGGNAVVLATQAAPAALGTDAAVRCGCRRPCADWSAFARPSSAGPEMAWCQSHRPSTPQAQGAQSSRLLAARRSCDRWVDVRPDASLRGLRIGVPQGYFWSRWIRPSLRFAVKGWTGCTTPGWSYPATRSALANCLRKDRCKDLLAVVDEAEAEVTARTGEAVGQLKVNVPVSFGLRHFSHLWAEFMALHPRVTLDVTLTDRVVDLLDEGYDLAVRIAHLPSSSLVSRQLSSTRLILCACPTYVSRHGAPADVSALASHAVIAYTLLSMGDHWQFERPDGPTSVTDRRTVR